MASGKRKLKIIYVVAALVCLSALAFAGVTYIRKWHFVGEKDGAYIFQADPEKGYSESIKLDPVQSVRVGGGQFTTTIMESESKKQAEKDLIEIEKLRAEGKRELLEAIEKKMDTGETIKIYRYKYVLSDGREIVMAEGRDSDERTPEEVKTDIRKKLEQAKKDYEEKVSRARQEGKREIAKIFGVEVDGKVLTAYLIKYKMPDGSEVDVGEGDDVEKELRPALGQEEFDRLTKDIMEKKGESLNPEEREIEGRKFIFSRSKFKLSDGREVIYSEGEPSK